MQNQNEVEVEIELDGIDLTMLAFKEINLIPEDCNDWDILYNFRHYICKISHPNSDYFEYETVLYILNTTTHGGWYQPTGTRIDVVGMPIDEKKRA